jgi:hypothetical protein
METQRGSRRRGGVVGIQERMRFVVLALRLVDLPELAGGASI